MSRKTLQLPKLSLKMRAEKLKLEVTSSVDIRFPSGWGSALNGDTITKAITSGNVWVSRGGRCRLDVEVLYNKKPLDVNSRIRVLESLGYHVRDSNIWSPLSLSSSLDISQSFQSIASSNDFSIFISHAMKSAESQSRAWLLNNIDFKAPKGVLCAELDVFQIQLSFEQIKRKPRTTSKRIKSTQAEPDTPDYMLLDSIFNPKDDARLSLFDCVATVLPKGISSSFAKCFDDQSSHSPIKLVGHISQSSDDKNLDHMIDAASTEVIPTEPTQRKKGERFSKETVKTLQECLDAYPGHSYVPHAKILDLMEQTGLEKKQIRTWLSNARCKRASSGLKDTSISTIQGNIESFHSGSSHREDEMLFGDEFDSSDEMLLPQTVSIITTSLTSQMSATTTSSSSSSLKRLAHDENFEASTLPLTPANLLTSIALRTLIAGPSNRKRDMQGVSVSGPLPTTNVSLLVPSMFSPGFKSLMAHNSRFLPTITNALCSSWNKNAQGVVLREKLAALSNANASQYHVGEGEEGSEERLASVVQARLWRMMQRTLHDQDAAKKLWNKGDETAESTAKEARYEKDEDLLGGNHCGETIISEPIDPEDHTGSLLKDDDEESLFEDLLIGSEDEGSDDGLLGFMEEQERLAVEAETEEMLFGSLRVEREGEDEGEEMLLFGENNADSMLL